jgi:hypothetical protein
MTTETIADPEKTFETWEVTTAGRVWLQTTTFTRHGQPNLKDVSLGPNKVGAKLKISVADREMNQEKVANEANDPFRNGLLVRVDASQQANPETASTDAVATKDLLAIFSKNGNAFQSAVKQLGEVPVRRMRELANQVDATAKQVEFLDALIEERYRRGHSQEDAVFDLSGERRRDLEGR